MHLFVRTFNRVLFLCLLGSVLLGCSGSTTHGDYAQSVSLPVLNAEPWSSSDSLFRSDPKWLGGDAATSINLGDDRVLWLFGDSLIAISNMSTRNESVMIRNSIAIQYGYNPSLASIKFYWRNQDKRPQSFFPGENDKWFWPGQGIRINDTLLIFLMEIRSSVNEFGFETTG